MNRTAIEWTRNPDGSRGCTINPLRARLVSSAAETIRRSGHYCEKIGPGCRDCYSSRFQPRFGLPEFGAGQHLNRVELFLDEAKLEQVMCARKPTRIFWCDMTDLFGAWVKNEWIDACIATMAWTPQHTHMVLTKRAERMRDYLQGLTIWRLEAALRKTGRTLVPHAHPEVRLPLPNVWIGHSVESQEYANQRIPFLLQTPAAVRFLSCEPLLGPVRLDEVELPPEYALSRTVPAHINALTTHDDEHFWNSHAAIDWVIVGGESGNSARPMHPDWARSIRDQCVCAGVPFFFKQWGAWAPWCNEDHFTSATDDEERHAHAWLDSQTGDDGSAWIIDDDGLWSNWTGNPRMVDGNLHPAIAVMGRHGKKAAGRELDGRTWDESPCA